MLHAAMWRPAVSGMVPTLPRLAGCKAQQDCLLQMSGQRSIL